MSTSRLILLTGPSCAGKSPLYAAFQRFYPEQAGGWTKLVLYNSRAPRPGERDGVDYHFRRREEIQALRQKESFTVLEARGDLQAVDQNEVRAALERGPAFFEGNPYVALELNKAFAAETAVLSIFLSPLSKEELLDLRQPERHLSLPDFVTDLMTRKLLRRTERQKGTLSLPDLENIQRRASSAYQELRLAWQFQHVIACHDGEESENWNAFYYPLGEARRALLAFAELASGRLSSGVEKWEEDLLP